MAILRPLARNVALSTTAADMISTITNEGKTIGTAVFTNASTSTAYEVTVYILSSTQEAGTANYLVKKVLQPGQPWTCLELIAHTIYNGDKVQAKVDAGSSVIFNASGAI